MAAAPKKPSIIRKTIVPAFVALVLLVIILAIKLDPHLLELLKSGSQFPLNEILHSLFWLTIGVIITRLIELLFWQGFIEKRIETKVPKLLKTIVNGCIFLIIIILIVGFVFHQSITGLVATTGALGIILGFGMKSTIESAFNGIALSVDRVIQIGDMVTIRGVFDVPSKVMEITWRYTIFQDANSNLIIVPNTTICSAVVTNYSRPSHFSCFSLMLTISVPVVFMKRIKRILEAALRSTSVIVSDPPPYILIADMTEASIKYQLCYWIDFTKVSPEQAKNELYQNVMHHFTIAGIGLEVTSSKYRDQAVNLLTTKTLIETVLKETKLFSELNIEEIKLLASLTETHSLRVGEVIIRQGEAGSSMYVIAEGLFKVDIEDAETHKTITVAKLVPGQYFGEMSLLVGDPRSATVTAVVDSEVYEITKETMQKLFETHPNLIKAMSNKIAERQVTNLRQKQALAEKDVSAKTQSIADKFAKLIEKWFWHSEHH